MWVMVTKCCLGNIDVILVQLMDYKGERPGNEAIFSNGLFRKNIFCQMTTIF